MIVPDADRRVVLGREWAAEPVPQMGVLLENAGEPSHDRLRARQGTVTGWQTRSQREQATGPIPGTKPHQD